MKKLFNKEQLTPSCSYCVYGRPAPKAETILCHKLGIVDVNYSCKKFKYDPLKRQPRRPKPIEEYDESDFSLAIDTEK